MKKIISLLILLFVSPLIDAQELTLNDVYQRAKEYSLSRDSSEQDLEISREQYSQAKGSVLPSVSLRMRHFRQDPIAGQNFADNDQTSTFLNVSQPLLQGLREYTALGIARQSIDRAQVMIENVERNLLFSSARLFYGLLIEQSDLKNLIELQNLTQERVRDLRARVNIGRSRQSELILAESQLVTLQSRQKSIERNLASLWSEFELLTGISNRPAFSMKTDSIELGTMGSYLGRLEHLPELQRAKIDIEISDKQVELARRYHYPELTFDGNYYVQRDGVQRLRDWDMSLNLRFPLFEGFRVQSRTREAALRKNQSMIEYENTKRLLESEIREIYTTLEIDLNRVTVTKRAVDLAKRNYDEQRREYNLGLVTNQEVLQALNAYIENQQSYDRLRLESAYNATVLKAKVGENL
jgi:outer membrane protein TolC